MLWWQLALLYLREKYLGCCNLVKLAGLKFNSAWNYVSLRGSKPELEHKIAVLEERCGGVPEWYKIAMEELGVSEVPGPGNNPRISLYHMATRIKDTDDSIPWCSSFVCWCLEKVGKPSTNSAWARSYVSYGNAVKYPKKGDICVFSRGKGGHVGFYHDESERDINVLGGNQGNKVSIMNFPKTRLLAIRRPE
jgi:uncharacterized protein (TIGR02594 family)